MKAYKDLATDGGYNVVKSLLVAPDFSPEFINDCDLDFQLNLSLITAETLTYILEAFKNSVHKQFPYQLLMKDVLIKEDRILKVISETDNKPVEFIIEFVGKDANRYKYEISYDAYRIVKEELNYYPNKKVKKLFERVVEEDKKATIHKGVFGKDIDLKEIAIFHNQTLLSKFGEDIPNKILSDVYIYFKNIDVINAFSSSRIADLNIEITKEIKNDEILFNRLKELIKFADTGIVSLNLQETNESDFKFPENIPDNLRTKILEDYKDQLSGLHNRFKDKEHIGSAPLPFDEESHGTNILYSLGGRMLRALENGTPLFVDEICTGLHLKLIQILVGLFQNERINPKNAQLIFTSHSINLLDQNMFRKDQIWFVEKDKYGESDLYSLQDFPDVREDTPFDKWYMAGKFGGLPNLKSLESLFIHSKR
ncbi:MAG: ATP-binding protein [Marinifilaceae bacterium]